MSDAFLFSTLYCLGSGVVLGFLVVSIIRQWRVDWVQHRWWGVLGQVVMLGLETVFVVWATHAADHPFSVRPLHVTWQQTPLQVVQLALGVMVGLRLRHRWDRRREGYVHD